MNAIIEKLDFLSKYRSILNTAAFYHDWGKSHPVFQAVMHDGTNELEENILAKRPKSKGPIRYKRKYFRHELASALALLKLNEQHPIKDLDYINLITYIIASHHGHIRLSIRPPVEEIYQLRKDDGNSYEDIIYGVKSGDVLPSIKLCGDYLPEIILDNKIAYIGTGEKEINQSWLERMLDLVKNEELGPYRLAYLESILRIADWRASAKEDKINVS